MTDNLNVSCFNKLHLVYRSLNEYSIVHPCPNGTFEILFLLFDLTYLFKNIYNNWHTEKLQKLQFIDPDSGDTMVASFKHVKEIYEAEKHLTVRLTGFYFATIYPTNFDKQKVRLTMNVFNDKVVTEVNRRGHSETARFAQLVCRMINVLNVKHPETGKRLLDPDKAKFVNADDSRFDLLKKMVGMFKSMGNQHSRYPGRGMHLSRPVMRWTSVLLESRPPLSCY